MKLYCNHQSRSNMILPLLKELEIENQVELIEVAYGKEMHSPDYLAINPMGKVPCLVDGEITINETPAIFAYLADKFIEKGLAPQLDDPQRGSYYKWLFFGHGPLTEYMNIQVLDIDQVKIAQVRSRLSYGDASALFDFLKRGLSQANPYLLGQRISVADLYIAYSLVFAISFKIIPYLDEFKPFLKNIQKRDSLKDVTWFQNF